MAPTPRTNALWKHFSLKEGGKHICPFYLFHFSLKEVGNQLKLYLSILSFFHFSLKECGNQQKQSWICPFDLRRSEDSHLPLLWDWGEEAIFFLEIKDDFGGTRKYFLGGILEQKYFFPDQVRTVLPVVGRATCWEGDPILHLDKAHPEIATKVFLYIHL